MTERLADAILRALGLTHKPAPGQIFHVEGMVDGNIRLVGVWESEAAFGQFMQERLALQPGHQEARLVPGRRSCET